MNVLIVSMSRLFIEALQVVIRNKYASWQIETYQIHAPFFNLTLLEKIQSLRLDLLVVEASNQQLSMITTSLKKLECSEVDILLLVDSRIGEVYHHLKNEKRWTSVTKETGLDDFLNLLESLKSNVPIVPLVPLQEMDKHILKELAIGQSFEYIQRTQGLSAEEMDQSLYRINSYFKVPTYIEAVVKAIEQNIIAY